MNYAIEVYESGCTGYHSVGFYVGIYRYGGESFVAYGNKDRDDIRLYKSKKTCENAIKKLYEHFFTIKFKIFENKELEE
jgi:hypothetical protein